MKPRRHLATRATATRQRGVVLIIALVMLVVISLLATSSIRNTVSSEAVSGNVRTTQLANQAAEIALRYCEEAVIANVKSSAPLPANDDGDLLTILSPVTPPRAVDPTNWDKVSTDVFPIPEDRVNLATSETFRRLPECMVERVEVVNATSSGLTTTSTYLITARGFGPEVPNDPARGRPDGSEVWLQSTIEIE